MASAASSSSLPLGKALASTEKKTRDRAIKGLSAFLSENSDNEIPPKEMDKLWKGVFYCFWMSDKPLVQQALASELAELVLTITSTTASVAFLGGFWRTITREWSGIDQLRLDKYYLLIRRFVNASFRMLSRAKWDPELCSLYNNTLTVKGGPLCTTDIKAPAGLTYHICDVYFEELNKVQLAASLEATPAPLLILLSPFLSLSAQTMSKITFKRIRTSVFEQIFASLSADLQGSEDSEDDEEEERPRKRTRLDEEGTLPGLHRCSTLEDPSTGRLDKTALAKGLRRRIFEVAADPATRDSNRRQLYALWKEEGEMGSDSDEE